MWNQDDARQGKTPTTPPLDASATGSRKEENRPAHFGRSVQVKGQVTGSEDLTIDGEVEGKIDLPDHVLTVGPNATIHADVKARVVMVFGTVLGSITAKEKIDLRRGGSVEGEVVCGRLTVQEGANLSGKVETKGERNKDKSTPLPLASVA